MENHTPNLIISSLLILTLKPKLVDTGSKPHPLTPNPFSPLHDMERGQG